MGENLSGEMIITPAKKKRNLFWLWIVLTAVLAGGSVALFAYRHEAKKAFVKDSSPTETASTPQATATPAVSVSAKPASSAQNTTVASQAVIDAVVTWLPNREKLGDLNLFKSSQPDSYYAGADYYKVATTSDGGEIILALAKMDGLGTSYDFHHFLKRNNKYYWLTQNSDTVDSDSPYALNNVQTDAATTISSLRPDAKIITGSTVLTQSGTTSRNEFAQALSTDRKVADTKWGGLYLSEGQFIGNNNTDAKTAQYFILRNDGIKIIYSPSPAFRLDDNTFNVTWSNPVGKGQKFSPIVTSGCGSGAGSFPLAVKPESLASKTEAASSASGSKLYAVRAGTSLADFGYQMYLLDGASGKVAKDVFLNDLSLLVWQDDYGSSIVYLNDKYAPAVECGKPVIYLYPEKDTAVSVKVGANIRKSEPDYAGGWNVLAKAGGELVLNGKLYPYLFWEGKGHGVYPEIRTGTIVKQSEAANTITRQLAAIGLSEKEIADFNEFWLPKLPKTPYIRLTWLTTPEMDRLAPLSVSPRPDTSIRVFLDFEGLDQPVAIQPQILPKYQRKGFTLVEWGGLLKGDR